VHKQDFCGKANLLIIFSFAALLHGCWIIGDSFRLRPRFTDAYDIISKLTQLKAAGCDRVFWERSAAARLTGRSYNDNAGTNSRLGQCYGSQRRSQGARR
jgi:hypothetical protein